MTEKNKTFVDGDLKEIVTKIYNAGWSKGFDVALEVSKVSADEPDGSNDFDHKSLNSDERAIWEQGHTAGYDEAVTDYERAQSTDSPDELENKSYNSGYEEGFDDGVASAKTQFRQFVDEE